MTRSTFRAAFWALCGASVILFIFFAAVGGIELAEATVATIVVALLAGLWLAHAWGRLWSDDEDPGSRPDRERRGF